jgi:hypothetical protein
MSDIPEPLIGPLRAHMTWLQRHETALVRLVESSRSRGIAPRFQTALTVLRQIEPYLDQNETIAAKLSAQIQWLIDHEAALTRAIETGDHKLDDPFEDALLALRRIRTQIARAEPGSTTPDVTVVREGRGQPNLKVSVNDTCIGWVGTGIIDGPSRRYRDATRIYQAHRANRVMFKRPSYPSLSEAIARLLEEADAVSAPPAPETPKPTIDEQLRAAGITRVEITAAIGGWVRIVRVTSGRSPCLKEAAAAFGLPEDLVLQILQEPTHRLRNRADEPGNPLIVSRS